mmetsp:Transcript_1949/g.3229  ORF Transcript_1949/g.3229 Transcript_1949/m.3229 type:complete len:217 (+) Transcript_1949:1751-2401(+)
MRVVEGGVRGMLRGCSAEGFFSVVLNHRECLLSRIASAHQVHHFWIIFLFNLAAALIVRPRAPRAIGHATRHGHVVVHGLQSGHSGDDLGVAGELGLAELLFEDNQRTFLSGEALAHVFLKSHVVLGRHRVVHVNAELVFLTGQKQSVLQSLLVGILLRSDQALLHHGSSCADGVTVAGLLLGLVVVLDSAEQIGLAALLFLVVDLLHRRVHLSGE